MFKIQIGVALARNSEKYLEFLMWSIDKTAMHPEQFQYVLGLNGADRGLVERVVGHRDAIIIDTRVDDGYGSDNHGKCLDLIFSRMTTRYGMLIDCDVAFLHEGWDDEMLWRLNSEDDGGPKENGVIIGAEYDGEKYRKFPNVICAMMDVHKIRELGVSFRPEGHRRQITGDDLDVYGYPRDAGAISIVLDTGSELPRKVKAAGLRGLSLPIYRAGDPSARFMREPMRGEEYQWLGVPLFTHLGRSYTREFGIDPHAILWEQRVREYINENSIRRC